MLLEVQWDVSTVRDDLGCHVICWSWSSVFYQVQSQYSHLPGDFGALYASICWQALWRCWLPFPAGLGTCPHCQNHFQVLCWPWYAISLILVDILANMPDLTRYGIFSWETVNPTIQMSWRLNSASAVPQVGRFHATPHWCWSLC